MNMQDLASIAGILSAVGVLLSLVFVGFQIRQNTQSQRVLAVESLAAAITAINVPAMESPTLGAALAKVTKDWRSASRDERIIAHFFLFSFFKLLETAWYQRKAKALDETQWTGWATILLAYYHSPGIQSGWWPLRRNAYSPEFQNYLAATARPSGLVSVSDLFDDPAPEEVPNV